MISTICQKYKPSCPRAEASEGDHATVFRYINNKHTSTTLQPRYHCHTCKKSFTLMGHTNEKRIDKTPPPLDGEKEDEKRIDKTPPPLDGEKEGGKRISETPPPLDGEKEDEKRIDETPPPLDGEKEDEKRIDETPPLLDGEKEDKKRIDETPPPLDGEKEEEKRINETPPLLDWEKDECENDAFFSKSDRMYLDNMEVEDTPITHCLDGLEIPNEDVLFGGYQMD
ncbi:hypothetical protein SUGI_0478890 [Cryptomeria japonica]|nr:hypothetical protein SUGI_0478890 [Cryptomeria japonica]